MAVKIQHGWLRDEMPGDLRTVKLGIGLAGKIFERFDYDWLYKEVSKNIPIEMDFRIEASNAKRTAKIFENDKRICVPKVYDKFTKSRLLVMSFEKGISVTKVK